MRIRDWTKAGVFVGLTALGVIFVVAVGFGLIMGWFDDGRGTRWIVDNSTAGAVYARLDDGGQPGQLYRIGPGEMRLVPEQRPGALELLDAQCALLDMHDAVTVPPRFLIAHVGGSSVNYVVDDNPGQLQAAPRTTDCSVPAS